MVELYKTTEIETWCRILHACVQYRVSLRGKPFSLYSLETHAEKVVIAGERPSMPPTWSTDVTELLTCAWRGAAWESTSMPSRSRGQHRVDGVGRPK